MKVYETGTFGESSIIIDREDRAQLIVVPSRGDVVCMGVWRLPESATELMSDDDLRYEVLGQVEAKLADVEMSQKSRDGVKDALAALGYEE